MFLKTQQKLLNLVHTLLNIKDPIHLKRISEKIDGMSLLGEYPPITNVKGFYSNEFTGELRRFK